MFGGSGFDVVVVAEDCGVSRVLRVDRRFRVQWRRSPLEAEATQLQFLRHHQMVVVSEGQAAHTFVAALETIERPAAAAALLFDDRNGGGGARRLRLVAGNDDDAFELDETGALKTTRELDAESRAHYELRVRIGDNEAPSNEAIVTIRVRNLNDHAPSLAPLEPQRIEESAPIGTIVARARANDADIERCLEFSLLVPNAHFHIQRFTGDIVLIAPLDAETQPEYSLHIQVSDAGGDGERSPLDTNGTLEVAAIEANDRHIKLIGAYFLVAHKHDYAPNLNYRCE